MLIGKLLAKKNASIEKAKDEIVGKIPQREMKIMIYSIKRIFINLKYIKYNEFRVSISIM